MTPLLESFLAEARECLQGIGEKLMQLEDAPDDTELMTALFRMVHTLKGNSGLFEFPEMTRVLHAGEDLMDAVRHGRVAYSKAMADALLDAMDFVGLLCDEIEQERGAGSAHAADAVRLAQGLRALLVTEAPTSVNSDVQVSGAPTTSASGLGEAERALRTLPDDVRTTALRHAHDGDTVYWVVYTPNEECFFQGEDPFHQARRTPGVLWGHVSPRAPWPHLAELDAYRCVLSFALLSNAPRAELDEHFRYMPDQIHVVEFPLALLESSGTPGTAASAGIRRSSPDAAAIDALVLVQRAIMARPITNAFERGRHQAAAVALHACLLAADAVGVIPDLSSAGTPLVAAVPAVVAAPAASPASDIEAEVRFGRRADDAPAGARSVKVDQAKIDRLMDLIGEMVVSKNALPYLAARADTVYGVRDLGREIKAQYAVINRIAEEMQDAIMQVRMLPVSFVFQRFPRLVRDTSRKLGKEVVLVLEGEETEADKHIIESLSDPLVHIIRNSLDHGFELPEVRRAAGKPVAGTLTIRAQQEADRVVIDIKDDGKGIDPAAVKQSAYAKGLITEADLERLTDREAIHLVFAPGFSTNTVVSDLSGRGVGMDVVRTAVEKVHGTVTLDSEVGKGTRLRLSLPLSMAVTNVMVVESDGQQFGMPMDCVVETVRVPRDGVRTIKQSLATVLRGQIVPLKAMNGLLGRTAAPKANADDELAVLVVRIGDDTVGLLVDNFREAMDIILKPLNGVLTGLSAYAGSALMGDGSVLMVLNPRELLA